MTKTNLTPDQRLARIEAFNAVQNVMGKYAYYHTANMHRECMDLFALDTPGVRAEMMWGVYEGRAGIERLYPGWHVWVDGDAKGAMHMHPLSTPVIEVAGDGKTARAVWICPGLETGAFGPPGTPITANWGWSKYGCDFIQENGEWKIWHLHVYGIFLCSYYKSWVDEFNDMGPMPMPDEFKPDRPPTTHWMYATDRVYANEPAPPLPYETFDESDSY